MAQAMFVCVHNAGRGQTESTKQLNPIVVMWDNKEEHHG